MGDLSAKPLASAKFALTIHELAPSRTPLSQSIVEAKATMPPIMEKPTMASQILRRMVFNDQWVALDL